MAVIGQYNLMWRSRVLDHISHSNTIVRIVPIEVGLMADYSMLITRYVKQSV